MRTFFTKRGNALLLVALSQIWIWTFGYIYAARAVQFYPQDVFNNLTIAALVCSMVTLALVFARNGLHKDRQDAEEKGRGYVEQVYLPSRVHHNHLMSLLLVLIFYDALVNLSPWERERVLSGGGKIAEIILLYSGVLMYCFMNILYGNIKGSAQPEKNAIEARRGG